MGHKERIKLIKAAASFLDSAKILGGATAYSTTITNPFK